MTHGPTCAPCWSGFPGIRTAASKSCCRTGGENQTHDRWSARTLSAQRLVVTGDGGSLTVSRLFNVRNKTVQREALVKFDLMRSGSDVVSYSGPELRQPDGFTFMALVNMTRDFRVGTAVAFEPSVLCNALVGYYDTRSRLQLKESIKRLMQAVITFPDFSVQLAQKFLHPARGMWSVALDPQIVRLFGASNYIWLDLQLRRELTEGLATWLYGYIRGQSYLNPTRLELLHEASGSDAKSVAAFQRSLYPALRELTERGVLEPGARVQDGVLHWRRTPRAQGA
ncbi:plasmid replication initiator TrfA [Aquabacterium sp. OR-4]|uniref:plasmid replication initiator TrfA n=1 Tax=Aquabacterium sp. OR-4 TaxID=2978127 RepID=UPI0028C8C761|nr:plasmid replication initiator TrfA [Aquabacterium sp. OR-4]MDT7836363.1 plasmid replication initiator TrfA [Aquabacterium sp. OR-4]